MRPKEKQEEKKRKEKYMNVEPKDKENSQEEEGALIVPIILNLNHSARRLGTCQI